MIDMSEDILQTRENTIIAEFNALPDVDAKYAHLFQLAENLPEMDPSLKTDANLVKNCQSALWCCLSLQNGRVYVAADSDSLVIKGIAALLMRVINGNRPSDVAKLNLDFIDQLKIWKLTAERNSSLAALLAHIKAQARALPCAKASTQNGNNPCQN